MRSGSALVTETIGGRSPSTEMPRRRATSVPAAPISWASASSSTSWAPRRLATPRRPARPGSARRRPPAAWPPSPCPAGQGAHRGDLREQDAGQRHRGGRQVLVRGHRLLGRQRAHPPQRLEADRTDNDQFGGDRLEQQFGLTDQGGQLGFDAGRGHQLFEGLQPRAALAAEGHGVGLACVEAVHQSKGIGRLRFAARSRRTPGRARGSSPCLSSCSSSSRFVSVPVAALLNGPLSIRVESPPVTADRCVRRTPPRRRGGARELLGCTKSVIRIRQFFDVEWLLVSSTHG